MTQGTKHELMFSNTLSYVLVRHLRSCVLCFFSNPYSIFYLLVSALFLHTLRYIACLLYQAELRLKMAINQIMWGINCVHSSASLQNSVNQKRKYIGIAEKHRRQNLENLWSTSNRALGKHHVNALSVLWDCKIIKPYIVLHSLITALLPWHA